MSVNPHCECEQAGFCRRHKMEKDQRRFEYCKGTSQASDCGLAWWLGWEQGFNGATKPADPVLDPEWPCEHVDYRPVHVNRPDVDWPPDRCRVGKRVKLLLKERYNKTPGVSCRCNEHAVQMDNWGCDECENQLERIVAWMMEEAWAHPLQSLAIAIKSPLDSLRGRNTLRNLILDAIDIERARIQAT